MAAERPLGLLVAANERWNISRPTNLLPNCIVHNRLWHSVNYADLVTAIAFVACPAVAGSIALRESAGWFSIGLVVVGLVAGIATAYVVHRVAYLILSLGIAWKVDESKAWWIYWTMWISYFCMPYAIAVGSAVGIGFGCEWLVMRE
jgi:hypothetical protein